MWLGTDVSRGSVNSIGYSGVHQYFEPDELWMAGVHDSLLAMHGYYQKDNSCHINESRLDTLFVFRFSDRWMSDSSLFQEKSPWFL